MQPSGNNHKGVNGRRFPETIGAKEQRKLRAEREGRRSILFGLGMFGVVGWAVALPTVAGIAVGIWLDSRFETRFSLTLIMLGAGVLLGCINAWYWVKHQDSE